jgi:hypothetical protein
VFTARYGLNIIQVNFRVYSGAMAQAVIRQPLTAESRVRSQVGPCGVYDGQSGNGTEFSDSTSVFPC